MENELMDRVAGHVLVACEDIEHIANTQMRPRLEIAAQMAAALMPTAVMSNWPVSQLVANAVNIADALIEACADEPAKTE
ncbi:hypothetical protein [Caudoviricetes sp.]|nr:hypothetical protein [Caudoviricetes sp.]